MKRTAQAALEFLTTYGWAFVLIIVMIGAMTYFGILNPKKLLPERCSMSSEFICKDYRITESSIKLLLRNNQDAAIILTGVSFESDAATQITCTQIKEITPQTGDVDPVYPLANPFEISWSRGEVKDFEITGCNAAAAGILSGSKEKILVELVYYNAQTSDEFGHTSKGEILATVQ